MKARPAVRRWFGRRRSRGDGSTSRGPVDQLSTDARTVIEAVTTCLRSSAGQRPADLEELPAQFAMAALAHAIYLLERIDDQHRAGHDFVVRFLARAHQETWIVGTYLHLGGTAAFQRFAGSYAHETNKQHQALAGHDEKLAAAQARIQKLNDERLAQNDGIRERNRRTGEQIPLRPLLEVPEAEPYDMNFGPVLEELRTLEGIDERELPVSEMAEALPGLAEEKGYRGGQTSAIYDLVYRGLSNLGTHTNYFVLEKYVDHSPETGTIACRTQPAIPPMGAACLHGAVLTSAMLAQWVLADRGCDLTSIDEVVNRLVPTAAPDDAQ